MFWGLLFRMLWLQVTESQFEPPGQMWAGWFPSPKCIKTTVGGTPRVTTARDSVTTLYCGFSTINALVLLYQIEEKASPNNSEKKSYKKDKWSVQWVSCGYPRINPYRGDWIHILQTSVWWGGRVSPIQTVWPEGRGTVSSNQRRYGNQKKGVEIVNVYFKVYSEIGVIMNISLSSAYAAWDC